MKVIYLRFFLLFSSAYIPVNHIYGQLASWNFENVSGPIPSIPILPSALGAGIASADIDNFGLMMNNFSVIPEPSSSLLMGLGLAGLAVLRLRRVRKNG